MPSQIKDYPLYDCPTRGHRFLAAQLGADHVEAVYDDSYFRVLDVGSAAGYHLQSLVAAGWQGVGIEPNERMAAITRQQFGLRV